MSVYKHITVLYNLFIKCFRTLIDPKGGVTTLGLTSESLYSLFMIKSEKCIQVHRGFMADLGDLFCWRPKEHVGIRKNPLSCTISGRVSGLLGAINNKGQSH